jgi:hypothetical protein
MQGIDGTGVERDRIGITKRAQAIERASLGINHPPEEGIARGEMAGAIARTPTLMGDLS